MTRHDRLIRIADCLARVDAGSEEADRAIHKALGLAGPAPPYTTDEAAARTLLPPRFEWTDITPVRGRVYAPCRRVGDDEEGLPYPHHGQLGRTMALSRCGSALRAWAKLGRG